jgi:ribosomal protein S27E
MKFTGDLIKDAISKGYKPILNRGMVLKSKCPKCGKITLIKFSPAENSRKRVHACVCGHHKGLK